MRSPRISDYAADAETAAVILKAAISAYPASLWLQQVQHRSKDPASLKKRLEEKPDATPDEVLSKVGHASRQ